MRTVDYAGQITESVEALKNLETQTTNARIYKRIQFLRLLKSRQVRFLKEACQIVGMSDVWGQQLWQNYKDEGLEKYLKLNYTRRKTGKLSAAQETRVNEKAEVEGFDSQAQAQEWIVGEFRVRLSPSAVSRLFGRLEITAKVPRPVNRKTSSEEQAAYKKNSRHR